MKRAGIIFVGTLVLLTAWTGLNVLAADLYVSPEGDGNLGTYGNVPGPETLGATGNWPIRVSWLQSQ